MLREWEKKYPGRIDSIFGALGNVVPSHLLDGRLFDFGAVRANGVPATDGDIAFDADPALEGSTAASAEKRVAIDAIAIRPSADD
jgi:tRNA 2-thiocytidine biosynthesis protein TtcA